jgi:hypothetical protein
MTQYLADNLVLAWVVWGLVVFAGPLVVSWLASLWRDDDQGGGGNHRW